MKNISIFGLRLVLFASLVLTACSKDNKGIYFTINEIVGGDILTGNQVSIPDNNISVYSTMSYTVNVQNASGTILAVSKDESIATVKVVNVTYSGAPVQDNKIVISGVQIGDTQIVVSDEDGNTATLNVKVEDVNLFWSMVCIYKKISLVEDEIVIDGTDETSAANIRTDILVNRAKERKFVIKVGQYFPWNVYKMQVLDKDDTMLYELVGGTLSDSNYKFYLPVQDETSDVKTFSFYEETNSFGQWLVEDITDDYKTQYPNVKVLLKMQIEKQ